jgi:hypothetical protein
MVEFYTVKTPDKRYPITNSLYSKEGCAGHCNICGEITIESCSSCPKWLCSSSRCWVQHGKDETEGWK